MLTLNHIAVCVAGRTLVQVDALQAVPGQVVALLGANGAGKTSLFKVMTGELSHQGQVMLHDIPFSQWSRNRLAKHLGVLPQASQLSFPFTVHEVVELGLIPLTASQQEGMQLVRKAMQETDTAQFAQQNYADLSGGERQRVHLARVLVQLSQAELEPLLLLDEPTSAQDLGQQHHMLALVRQLAQQNHWGVIVILHDLNQALRYCDQAWLLKQGQLIACGQPCEVLTPERIHAAWGYQPQMITTDTGIPMVY